LASAPIAWRTRAAVSAISAAAAGSVASDGASGSRPGRSDRSCRSHFRDTFSAMPQNQAPNLSGDRSRSMSVIAATAASCTASRARSGEPSTRSASSTATSQCLRSSSAIGSLSPDRAACTSSASEGVCCVGRPMLNSARTPLPG